MDLLRSRLEALVESGLFNRMRRWSSVLFLGTFVACATSSDRAWQTRLQKVTAQVRKAERQKAPYHCQSEIEAARMSLKAIEQQLRLSQPQNAEQLEAFTYARLKNYKLCADERAKLVESPKKRPTPIVAVMSISTSGEAKTDRMPLVGLTDQLRVQLGARGLRVVDRGQQEQALKQWVKRAQAESYRECVDVSCQIPLGKALAATHLMRSSVGRFGAQCTFNAELISLKEEVSVAAKTERSECSGEGLLDTTERVTSALVDQLNR